MTLMWYQIGGLKIATTTLGSPKMQPEANRLVEMEKVVTTVWGV